MHYSGVERRKHERFKAAIPVSIGLINLKEEKAIEAQFTGVTMDISMEGLSLELKHPEAGMFPFGDRLTGREREFDLEINVKVGRDSIRGVGEVRWASTPSPSVIRMGVFLKEIIEGETEKWRDFVISRSRG
ncbi:MAG: PilZ domain-containing protein, partial [Desulfobacterales bacterium]|nr:PilZ domain-containing protein [Desulfobacterales bacterium]